MSLYSDLATLSAELIATYGASCIYTSAMDNVDPLTGTVSGTESTENTSVVLTGISDGDAVGIISMQTMPKKGDLLAVAGIVYIVSSAKAVSPSGEPVVYKLSLSLRQGYVP